MLGEDYFKSPEDVMRWIKKVQEGKEKKAASQFEKQHALVSIPSRKDENASAHSQGDSKEMKMGSAFANAAEWNMHIFSHSSESKMRERGRGDLIVM